MLVACLVFFFFFSFFFFFFFFFSSRRRHTRYIGDWSSDVCSSDLMFSRPGHEEARPGPALICDLIFRAMPDAPFARATDRAHSVFSCRSWLIVDPALHWRNWRGSGSSAKFCRCFRKQLSCAAILSIHLPCQRFWIKL